MLILSISFFIIITTVKPKHKKMCYMNDDAFIKRFIVYCCTPKALYNHVRGGGGGLLNHHHQCASIHLDDTTAATGQRRQCAHQTPAGGEERET